MNQRNELPDDVREFDFKNISAALLSIFMLTCIIKFLIRRGRAFVVEHSAVSWAIVILSSLISVASNFEGVNMEFCCNINTYLTQVYIMSNTLVISSNYTRLVCNEVVTWVSYILVVALTNVQTFMIETSSSLCSNSDDQKTLILIKLCPCLLWLAILFIRFGDKQKNFHNVVNLLLLYKYLHELAMNYMYLRDPNLAITNLFGTTFNIALKWVNKLDSFN